MSEKEIKHGTRYAYRKGCRCELCRSNQAKRHSEWREKKKAEESAMQEVKPMTAEEIERRRESNDRWRERARLEAGLA